MRYLFVHQNYPGQYLYPIRRLLEQGGNHVLFISEANLNRIEGVQRAYYQFVKPNQDHVHPNAREWELQARRGDLVAQTAQNLKRLGYAPDVIIGHHGWGELLNLPDVWPGVPILGYFEYFYRTEGQDVGYDPEFPLERERFARVRALNIVNMLALGLDQHGHTPTRWQLSRYPDWAQQRIRLIPEGVRLDVCSPDAAASRRSFAHKGFVVAPGERLVTYVVRNLEPYRGFHTMMRALPRILSRRDVKVIMVGGDDVSYGSRLEGTTWREYFTGELAGQYDESRVLLPGQVPYDDYLALLRRSDVHVYLTYPFVASWSLREAMACGCAIVASDVPTVSEFITHDQTGVLVPGLLPDAVADAVLALLDDPRRAKRLRMAARRYAEQHLDVETQLSLFADTVAEITGRAPEGKSLAGKSLAGKSLAGRSLVEKRAPGEVTAARPRLVKSA